MSGRFCTVFVWIVCVAMHACSPDTVDESPETSPGITRLSPDTFPALPHNIATSLQAEGYTIPQCYLFDEPHNVVPGEFAQQGQVDWAVLCSKDGLSSIIVFWGGSSENVARLAQEPDESFLQSIDANGGIGFSRLIHTVDKEGVLDCYAAYGGPEPPPELPPIDHDGIDDAFAEKASMIHYFHEGRWLSLPGAD